MRLSSSKRYRFILLAALLFTLLLIPTGVCAQNSVQIILHYVEGQPLEGEMAYQVQAYLSVINPDGSPVESLAAQNFTITEDSRRLEVDSLELSPDTQMNLVLVLDTSGSMSGVGISSSRSAAQNFIQQLDPQDQIAVLSFNDELKHEQEFTTDHQSAANVVSQIQAVPDAGTCLYDAAYEAVQITATLPAGRRAVILLTDGVDEISSGDICSSHTIEDVISLASSGNTRVPIYTIGLGTQVDQNVLERLAEMSGGNALISDQASQLDALFNNLSHQLKTEYLVTYKTTAAPGNHTLIVSVDINGAIDQDSRQFLLPELPTSIVFISPTGGQQVSDNGKIAITLTGSGVMVKEVVFSINGEEIGRTSTYPYELAWDFSRYPAGDIALGASVVDTSGNTIAENSIVVEVASTAITPTVAITPVSAGITSEPPVEQTEEQAGITQNNTRITSLTWIVGGIALVVLAFMLVFFLIILPSMRRNGGKNPPPPPAEKVLATLTVLKSDEPDFKDKVLKIIKATTTFGREEDNDVVLPDKPVSRHHAILEQRSNRFILMEAVQIDAAGREKRPTYGTFVDNIKVGSDGAFLIPGALIRFGSRLEMVFEPLIVASKRSTESTMDDFDVSSLLVEQQAGELERARTVEDPVIRDNEEVYFYEEEPKKIDHTLEDPVDGRSKDQSDTRIEREKGDHTLDDPLDLEDNNQLS
jgi:VWFA-related protein